jgi:hypothetical protein
MAGFSGKALGALGVRKKKLTLPPFIPSRVVSSVGFLKAILHPDPESGFMRGEVDPIVWTEFRPSLDSGAG